MKLKAFVLSLTLLSAASIAFAQAINVRTTGGRLYKFTSFREGGGPFNPSLHSTSGRIQAIFTCDNMIGQKKTINIVDSGTRSEAYYQFESIANCQRTQAIAAQASAGCPIGLAVNPATLMVYRVDVCIR